MVFPAQSLTVRDPGLGVTNPAAKIPVFTGIALGGSQAVNTLGSINSLGDVRSVIGYGPLAEDVALALSQRGGPIYFIIHNSVTSAALTNQAITAPAGSPPAILASGTPRDRYYLRLQIIAGGVLGTSTWRYTLDGHDSDAAPYTWSETRKTPVGTTHVVTGSGITLTLPAGTYVAGDEYTYAFIPQEPGTVDLALAAAVLIAATSFNFNLWILSGAYLEETIGSGVAAALSGYLTTLTASFRYVRGICDVGSGDTSANVLLEAANWTSSRIVPCYGYTLRSSLMPFEGFSYRKTSCVSGIGVRATKELISTDLSRFASGADEGVEKIYFDGFITQTLDAQKISTMRTWSGMPGFYIANAKLKSAFGSDFTDLQFGRVMDVACRTTFEAQQPFVSESLRTIGATDATDEQPEGSIDERDAQAIERQVERALVDALLSPKNARGVPGHVSAVTYAVDRSVNLITTSQLATSVSIRPLGYAKDIQTDLFFSLA